MVVSFGILFGRLLGICLGRSVLLGKRVARSYRGFFFVENAFIVRPGSDGVSSRVVYFVFSAGMFGIKVTGYYVVVFLFVEL